MRRCAAEDGFTQRLRSYTDRWRSTVRVGDSQVAEMIRADRIDILVDLAMHTAARINCWCLRESRRRCR